MTGEEKQTSCESETCTVQATFILKCDRRGIDLVAYRNTVLKKHLTGLTVAGLVISQPHGTSISNHQA